MKKVIILGGGIAGIIASYTLKKDHPEYEVTIIEKDREIARRIKVSGNGRFNFGNKNVSADKYYQGHKIEHILNFFKKEEEKIYQDLSLEYEIDDQGRYYPLSNSSKSAYLILTNIIFSIGVKVIYDNIEHIIENGEKIILKNDKSSYKCDHLILSLGGLSYLYNQSNYQCLKNLNLKINPPKSSLCPLIIEEKIPKELIGKRQKGIIKLKVNNKIIYQEYGELLFKKDGLSGIAIFNISSIINFYKLKNCQIVFDAAPKYPEKAFNFNRDNYSLNVALLSAVTEELANYIISLKGNTYYQMKNLTFTYRDHYPLLDSQVTNGGVCLSNINLDNLKLIKHPHISVIGELLDIDGLCGGYNIYFAFASGYYASKHIGD